MYLDSMSEKVVHFLDVVFLLIFISVPILVYLDATKHRIGYILKNTFPAGLWATLSLPPFTFVTLIVYVIKRQKLIDAAKMQPAVVSTKRKTISIVLLLLYQLWFFSYDIVCILNRK